jgi:predicted SnoaL-like aldol condensation-catalyzing enzyme
MRGRLVLNVMADAEQNKQTVIAFYERAFNDHEPVDAVERYVGSQYIQHNPQAADGPEAFVQFVKWFTGQFPDLKVEIKRAIAEGDLVVTHSLLKTSTDDRGTAAADIFRLEDGKVVEHWDVLQAVPEESANDNTMF